MSTKYSAPWRNWLGVGRKKHPFVRRPLHVEQLEDRSVPAVLTVITHGLQSSDQVAAWGLDLASALNDTEYGHQYTQSQIDHSVVRYDAASNAPPAGGADSCRGLNGATSLEKAAVAADILDADSGYIATDMLPAAEWKPR